MVLDTSLLNTQHYKARFKGKVEQSREWSSAPLAIEKRAFRYHSTTVANFTYNNNLLFFYEDEFGINSNTKADISLNIKTKQMILLYISTDRIPIISQIDQFYQKYKYKCIMNAIS